MREVSNFRFDICQNFNTGEMHSVHAVSDLPTITDCPYYYGFWPKIVPPLRWYGEPLKNTIFWETVV
jgi:hypothetical protein